MAEIAIRNVTKSYGKTTIMEGVNLDILNGEFVVILGPSGCGKSTLLRLIAGLEEITAGEISIGGQVVNQLEPRQRGCAMVFQNYALYPHMTVAENIGYALKVAGTPKAERLARVAATAHSVGLGDFLERKPGQLSGGQRQRVAMARAIIREPKVFLFDEPLSNLDAKLRVQMRTEIRELHQRLKTTTVYVTHDQIEAMTLADRVVVMQKGLIQQVGTPMEIYDRPANTFVASFIGSPAMNLVHGDIADGVFTGDSIRVDGLSRAVKGPVTLGFRAEDAVLAGERGHIEAPIYSVELLGEATMISMRVAGELVSIKVGKDYRAEIGDMVRVNIAPAACHLFDRASGARIVSDD